MTDGELDFDPEELAMLRQLFRSEAQDALEAVTALVLAAGSAPPSREAMTEMMRATHTMKGAAGTVGLPAMVDLAHRLESAFAGFGRDPALWTVGTSDALVEVLDALRGYLDVMTEPHGAAAADELRTTIDHLLRPDRRRARTTGALEALDAAAEDAPPRPASDAGTPGASGASDAEDGDAALPVEPRSWLRVEPARIDDLMSSAGELLFDRTRIERRVQLLRDRKSVV